MDLFSRKILGFIFLLCSLQANSQVRFSASLSPAVISRDEFTTIRFLLENANNIKNITPPSFQNFILISGPFQESRTSLINGHTTTYLAISFVIKTKGPGKFKIPGAVADVGGKKYTSNPVELLVKKTRQQGGGAIQLPLAVQKLFEESRPLNTFDDYIFRTGDDVAEKVSKNMQLKLEVNKTSCYVGEPIIATYKLYTRLKSESKLTQNPSFNGFSVIDLQPAEVTGSSIEKINGREFNVYTIRKAQLYPLQDGQIDLESAELENNIQFIRESYVNNSRNSFPDIFDEFANAAVPPEAVIDQKVFLRSKPVKIEVKPLPEAGKPAQFKGAVGQFDVESDLEKTIFTTNESGKLLVTLSGSGNLQLMTAPHVAWPANFETFEPRSSDILSRTSVPVTGKKIFEYPFSVSAAGNYTVPAITFSYFDPSEKVYRTITTKEINFSVKQGTPAVVQAKADIPEIRQVQDNNIWIYAVLAFAFITALVIFLYRRNNNIAAKTEQKEIETQLEKVVETSAYSQLNPLERSEKCLNDPECVEFYSFLMGDIKAFLAHKFHWQPEEVNQKRLAEKMDKLGIANNTVLSLQQLMQDIEWQLYTPFERNEKMAALYERSHGLIQMINTYDIKHQ